MAVEETKEQQQIYNIFRSCIYIFLICEIIVNLPITAHDPIVNFLVTFLNNLGFFNSVVGCKLIELTCVGITCIGSRPKKSLKFNVRRMVIYPACVGFYLLVFSLLVYKGEWGGIFMGVPLNRIIYASCSVFGIVFIHQAGDAISKYMRSKVGDDKFNFENESFQQTTEEISNDYSVNIPMIFYYQKKMNHGYINITNPFRGRRRTNRAISVKLIYWLKLNVNNLKSAIWVKQRKITENIRKGMTSGWLGTSVGNYRFCFPEFPTNLRTLNRLNSIILSQFGMCK